MEKTGARFEFSTITFSADEKISMMQGLALAELHVFRLEYQWSHFMAYLKNVLSVFSTNQSELATHLKVGAHLFSYWINGTYTPHDPSKRDEIMKSILNFLEARVGR